MTRRCNVMGFPGAVLAILLVGMAGSAHWAQAAAPHPVAYPLPRVADSAPSGSAVAGAPAGAGPGSSAGAAAKAPATTAGSITGRVVELPTEVVHGGVSFATPGTFKFAVPGTESSRLPGGFADPTRMLQQMPGVSNDSDFDGLLYVRGGDGGQNRILLDQVSVSDAYHFGGVISVFNTDVIDRIEFMPGAYTAEYGDALSGVLQVRRRIGNLSRVRGSASVGVPTMNGTIEGPLGNDQKGSWLVAARRSYVDRVLNGRTNGPTALPAYWDVDSRIYRRVGGNDLRLGFLRSGDFLSARLSDSFTFAPAESSGLDWNRKLTMVSLNWERTAGPWALSQALAYSWRDQELELFGGLPQHAAGDTRAFDWRGDAKRPAYGLLWSAGGQLTHTHTTYDLDINRLSILEPDRRSNPRSPLDTARVVATYEGRNVYAAGYLQGEARLVDSTVTVTAGLRVESSSRSDQVLPTPRLRLAWTIPQRGLTLTAAAGSYRQFPGDRLEADPTVGNPDLTAERADHYVLGIAKAIPGGGRLSVEGYYKRLFGLIVYDPDAGEDGPPFVNTGTGQAKGLEFLVHVPRRRWDAWVSYTLGEVRYRDFPGAAEYAPAQDIRSTLAVVGRVRPGKDWTLGAKWRSQSGRPYTPVTGRENVSEFVDGVTWIPVLGEYNSGRFPWYQRLDLRGERVFRLGGTRLNAWAEVVNVLGRRNLYDYRYVDGYSRAQPVTMLPTLPTLGVSVVF